MSQKSITRDNLLALADDLIAKGFRVIAPKQADGVVFFGPVKSASEIALEFSSSSNSLKGAFFPKSECMFKYRFDKIKVELEEADNIAQKTVVLASHPCDAAALPILDKLFGWDYQDEYYFSRRNATTVVSVSCEKECERSFCTSVGCSPTSTEGSDLLLFKNADGTYTAEVLTPKGEALVAEASSKFSDSKAAVKPAFSGPAESFDLDAIKPWLDANFNHEFWKEIAYRCIGCGTCAFVCPTCHCFDIVDEADARGGERRRNWDSCGFGVFTLHASGHNPRSTQDRRYRQRVMHKFKYYVEKFGVTACVGCGRCSTHCPVDIDIGNILRRIFDMAQEAAVAR